jgi:DHA1 family bicyclomycin/chloramphenicol resistance-like MFS transporter
MTDSSDPPRVRPALIANLLGQIAFGLVVMTICLPSMQEWSRIFDTDQAGVQLTFSGYVATYGVLQLIYGPMSDRFGRRYVLVVGLLLALVGSVLGALANDLTLLTLARVVQGMGGAAGMVVGRSMVHDLFTGNNRTRMMAYIGMTLGVCPPSATIIGGFLHVQVGWQANFVLAAVLALFLLAAAWWGLPTNATQAHASHAMVPKTPSHVLRDMLSAYRQLVCERSFMMYLLVLSTTTATFYTVLGGAPIVLKSYGVGPDGVGWYVMFGPLSYIAGNFMTSRLIHIQGEKRVMVVGQTLSMCSGMAMVLLSVLGWHAPMAFALPLLLLGFGHGLLVPPALAGSIGILPALAGSAAGAIGLMQQWTGAFGGYSVGWFTHENATNLGFLMMAFTSISLGAQAFLNHWRFKPKAGLTPD